MVFELVTIFPEIFDSYISESILGRAVKKRLIKIRIHNLRRFSPDKKHHKVDDRPYGGGPGMVMGVPAFWKSVQHLTKLNVPIIHGARRKTARRRVLMTSAKGTPVTQADFKRWSGYDQLIILCGRYEGIDDRVTKFVDEEISIGSYVLTGGELPAAVVVDGVSRLLPGVLGTDESSTEESHSAIGVLEYPQYTRPDTFSPKRGIRWSVPAVLKTGNHKLISEWRKQHSKRVTTE